MFLANVDDVGCLTFATASASTSAFALATFPMYTTDFKLFDNGLKLDISSYPHMNIRMSTKGKRPLRSLTPSDKIHAIQRIHDGESKASVARDIGVPESTLRGWCKNEDKLRFMSRQSGVDKLSADGLVDGAAGLLGPPEKRQRLDSSLPLNFSNKMKFDELTFKRSPLNGLDYSTNKALSDLNFNGLPPDYAALNGVVKNKVFGADINRPTDPAIAAISPLSSLTHLSGLSGIAQSPLAISFNELTSNLNLLAQLNPGLAAMSGLNSLAATANTLRNVKPKPQTQLTQSPRSESGERQQGITVKNWAKQKPATSNDVNCGLNLSQGDPKSDLKSQNAAMHMGSVPPLPGLPDDPLLYWLKSQQSMLGLSSLYPPPPPPPTSLGPSSPPMRSSTPQQSNHIHAGTPPTAVAPLTPANLPAGSLDDKSNAWFNWCKAFGASLHSLAPNAAAMASLQASSIQQQATSTTIESANSATDGNKTAYENILYSQLTKDSASSSAHSTSSHDNMHQNNEVSSNTDAAKPEDLSAKSVKAISPPPSPIPTPATITHSPERASPAQSPRHSPIEESEAEPDAEADVDAEPEADAEADTATIKLNRSVDSLADCKDVLDNILYKINNNPNSSLGSTATPTISVEAGSESDASYNSENQHHHHHHNNNDVSASNHNNNNNNSNKTDEEERAKCIEYADDIDDEDMEAIKHGEKFLQWLENCSNPRVTAVQLTQLRFLIAAIKTGNETKFTAKPCITAAPAANLSEGEENASEEASRNKIRRRK